MHRPESRTMVLAATTLRLWTRFYTAGLPPALRDARRLEIESDLWEYAHDPERGDVLPRASYILLRLFRGAFDDVRWRQAHDRLATMAIRAGTALTVALLVFIAWSVLDLMRTRVLPLPPDPPAARVPHTLAAPSTTRR
jgi:hypothetical protein